MDLSRTVQEIQYTLAPAIMISSSALLLLGLQAKFSNLFNRFRALNQERRILDLKTNRSPVEDERLSNLKQQLHRLMLRILHTKNAISLNYLAIVCFLATSIFLFLNIYTPLELSHFTITFFSAGLVLVLISACFMIAEIGIAFNILKLERKS